MKTLVCIEKIGGISGKRINIRLIRDITEYNEEIFNIYSPKKSNTLFINPSLLESVLKILDNNKNYIYEERSNFWNSNLWDIEVGEGYLLAEINYESGEIKKIKPMSITEGIEYLESNKHEHNNTN